MWTFEWIIEAIALTALLASAYIVVELIGMGL